LKIIHVTCHIIIVPHVVTCQVSKMTRVKSLFESQFSPYICYFNYISVHFFIFNFIFSKLRSNLTLYKFYNDIFIKHFNNIKFILYFVLKF